MALVDQTQVIGVAGLSKVLDQLPERIAKNTIKKGLRAAARVIVKEARVRVQRRTGELRRAISSETRGNSSRKYRDTVIVGIKKPTSRRAHLVEFGTKHAAAKPFLRPALDAKASEANGVAVQRIAEEVGKEAEKLSAPYKSLTRSSRRALARG